MDPELYAHADPAVGRRRREQGRMIPGNRGEVTIN